MHIWNLYKNIAIIGDDDFGHKQRLPVERRNQILAKKKTKYPNKDKIRRRPTTRDKTEIILKKKESKKENNKKGNKKGENVEKELKSKLSFC